MFVSRFVLFWGRRRDARRSAAPFSLLAAFIVAPAAAGLRKIDVGRAGRPPSKPNPAAAHRSRQALFAAVSLMNLFSTHP
jgi:hypothetical protein